MVEFLRRGGADTAASTAPRFSSASDFSGVIGNLARGGSDADAVLAAAALLREAALTDDACRCSLAKLGAIPLLLSSLKAFKDNARVAGCVCAALDACALQSDMATEIVASEGIPLLLGALATHQSDAVAVIRICRLLATVATDPARASSALEAGGDQLIPLLHSALVRQAGDLEAVQTVSVTLRHLASCGDVRGPRGILAVGALSTLAEAFSRFSGSSVLAQSACMTVAQSAAAAAAGAGGVGLESSLDAPTAAAACGLVISVLRLHLHTAEAVTPACGALSNLASDGGETAGLVRLEFVRRGGVALCLLPVLRRYAAMPAVLEWAYSAVFNLSNDPTGDLQRCLLAAGVAGLVTEALRKHSGSPSVLEPVCGALYNLAADVEGRRQSVLVAAGVVPPLVSILRLQLDSPAVLENACKALDNLCSSEGIITGVMAVEAPLALTGVLARYVADRRGGAGALLACACACLGKIALVDPGAACLTRSGCLPPLVAVLTRGELGADTVEAAACALRNIAGHSEAGRAAVVAAGCVPHLVSAWQAVAGSPSTIKALAGTLCAVAGGDPKTQSSFVTAGSMPLLVESLARHSGDAPAMLAVLAAVFRLITLGAGQQGAGAGDAPLPPPAPLRQSAVGAAGGVYSLVAQLGKVMHRHLGDPELVIALATALGALAAAPGMVAAMTPLGALRLQQQLQMLSHPQPLPQSQRQGYYPPSASSEEEEAPFPASSTQGGAAGEPSSSPFRKSPLPQQQQTATSDPPAAPPLPPVSEPCVVALLVQALHAHRRSARAVGVLCGTLGRIVADPDGSTALAGVPDAGSSIVGILLRHAEEVFVVIWTCRALAQWILTDEKGRTAAAAAAEAAQAALLSGDRPQGAPQLPDADPPLAPPSPSVAEQLVTVGAVQALATILRRHNEDAVVPEAALRSLCYLATSTPLPLTLLSISRAFPTALEVLEEHWDRREVTLLLCCRALVAMANSPALGDTDDGAGGTDPKGEGAPDDVAEEEEEEDGEGGSAAAAVSSSVAAAGTGAAATPSPPSSSSSEDQSPPAPAPAAAGTPGAGAPAPRVRLPPALRLLALAVEGVTAPSTNSRGTGAGSGDAPAPSLKPHAPGSVILGLLCSALQAHPESPALIIAVAELLGQLLLRPALAAAFASLPEAQGTRALVGPLRRFGDDEHVMVAVCGALEAATRKRRPGAATLQQLLTCGALPPLVGVLRLFCDSSRPVVVSACALLRRLAEGGGDPGTGGVGQGDPGAVQLAKSGGVPALSSVLHHYQHTVYRRHLPLHSLLMLRPNDQGTGAVGGGGEGEEEEPLLSACQALLATVTVADGAVSALIRCAGGPVLLALLADRLTGDGTAEDAARTLGHCLGAGTEGQEEERSALVRSLNSGAVDVRRALEEAVRTHGACPPAVAAIEAAFSLFERADRAQRAGRAGRRGGKGGEVPRSKEAEPEEGGGAGRPADAQSGSGGGDGGGGGAVQYDYSGVGMVNYSFGGSSGSEGVTVAVAETAALPSSASVVVAGDTGVPPSINGGGSSGGDAVAEEAEYAPTVGSSGSVPAEKGAEVAAATGPSSGSVPVEEPVAAPGCSSSSSEGITVAVKEEAAGGVGGAAVAAQEELGDSLIIGGVSEAEGCPTKNEGAGGVGPSDEIPPAGDEGKSE